jgi:hypothetical protein
MATPKFLAREQKIFNPGTVRKGFIPGNNLLQLLSEFFTPM